MRKKLVGIGICMLLVVAVVLPAAGTINKKEDRTPKLFYDDKSMEFVPGEFIVKLKKDAIFSKSPIMALNEKHRVYAVEKVFPNAEDTILDNIFLLHVPIGSDIFSIVHEYTSCPDVMYAEPNGRGGPCGIPNDTNFSVQWYLHNIGQVIYSDPDYHLYGTPDADIDAPEAWDIETGSPEVVIAIIDSGIDYMHPDLAANIWNNTDEIPNNSIDDDSNGYIDDIRGWYFYLNNSNVTDGHGHGTACAGIAGAVTNNGIGIAGVGWNCKIMPVRIANSSWSSTIAHAVQGIKYAADNGADVISMSFGFNPHYTLKDAVDYAYGKGVYLCAAAGNDNSQYELYPAAYENVTAVGMTNQNDSRCSPDDWGPGWGSRWGPWVDIAAPGNVIFTTMPTYHVQYNNIGHTHNYSYFQGGTSFSSPMVAGVAALLLSKDPSLTPDEVEALLCSNVDPYTSTVYCGTGRLNAQKALAALELKDGIEIKGGLGVKMVITNNGISDVTNITWQIHVVGGLFGMINKTKNGTIDRIPTGKSQTVSSGILLGLGSLIIDAQIAGIDKKANGTQLLIFSMVKK